MLRHAALPAGLLLLAGAAPEPDIILRCAFEFTEAPVGKPERTGHDARVMRFSPARHALAFWLDTRWEEKDCQSYERGCEVTADHLRFRWNLEFLVRDGRAVKVRSEFGKGEIDRYSGDYRWAEDVAVGPQRPREEEADAVFGEPPSNPNNDPIIEHNVRQGRCDPITDPAAARRRF